MRHSGSVLPVILVCGLVIAAGLPVASSETSGSVATTAPVARGGGGSLALIRIAKSPTLRTQVLTRLQIDVRQELTTCLLAFADRDDLDLLRRNGVRFTVLDRNAARREFLVVGIAAPGALASLRAAGHTAAVEPSTAVFWTEEGSALEAVPAGLPRKALPPRSVLPYVRTRPEPAPAPSVCVAQDPLVETIVSHVSSSNLAADVQTLQDFQTRYASTTNCEAAGEALFAAFSALGLDNVRFEPFTFSGSYASRNVVAEKRGETYPGDIFIVCSHYDSTSPSRLTLAPGADDNASGTAAVLEAARVLAPYPLDYTVRFIAFSAEEWGLWGSRAYASLARLGGQPILGVINLDMIGYADAMPEDLQIIVNGNSTWLADLFLAAGAHYGVVGATKTVDQSFVYSDHSPFWDNGYPALLAIEDNPLTNPYYHRTTDTLDTLNIDFFTSATRASVGLLAELAQPIKAGYPRTPVGLYADLFVYRSLFNSLHTVRLHWTAQTDATSYNIYRTDTPHLGYVKINTTPVTGTAFSDTNAGPEPTFSYAVTAVGPAGLESNRSRDAQWIGAHLDQPATRSASIGASSIGPIFGFPVLRGIR
jgi:hypothetical protein